MKSKLVGMVALVALFSLYSSVARATEAPNLTDFRHYVPVTGWVYAVNVSEYVYSCDDTDTRCYFVADYCAGTNPDLGTEFEMEFSFPSSGAFYSASMWEDDERTTEVYEGYSQNGTTWTLDSDDPVDIEWDLEGGVAYVGRFAVSLLGTTYVTYVYARSVVCK